MAGSSELDDSTAGRSGRRRGGMPVTRAGVLLILFVVLTVIALGKVHGSAPTVASASGPAATAATTTAPPAATTTTTTKPPSSVPVLVANASGVSGAAGAISSQLQVAGWSMLPAVNASARLPSSHVYYVAGHQQQANQIAQALHLPASAVEPYTTAAPISSIGTAEVVVVVGPDLASGAGTTTTT